MEVLHATYHTLDRWKSEAEHEDEVDKRRELRRLIHRCETAIAILESVVGYIEQRPRSCGRYSVDYSGVDPNLADEVVDRFRGGLVKKYRGR